MFLLLVFCMILRWNFWYTGYMTACSSGTNIQPFFSYIAPFCQCHSHDSALCFIILAVVWSTICIHNLQYTRANNYIYKFWSAWHENILLHLQPLILIEEINWKIYVCQNINMSGVSQHEVRREVNTGILHGKRARTVFMQQMQLCSSSRKLVILLVP